MAALLEMTFHGRNFDIITGITAPLLALLIAKKGELQTRGVTIAWNIMGIILVLIVVIHGMVSAPYSFKPVQLSRDNAYIGFFPMMYLLYVIVPAAFFAHMISLRKALTNKTLSP